MKRLFGTILLLLISIYCFTQEFGEFTDSRDDKTYKTVKIGEQVWMAENLAFKADSGCLAYFANDNNVKVYGFLYDWNAANIVCPIGWHLPTIKEYEELYNTYGGKGKSSYTALIDGGNSGFSVLLGGGFVEGGYSRKGVNGYFWTSSTEYKNFGWYCYFMSVDGIANMFYTDLKDCGFSVRCIKN